MDRIAQINKRREELQGDFELIYELRIIETVGSDPLVGLLYGGRGPYDHFGIWAQDRLVENRRIRLVRLSIRFAGVRSARPVGL